MFIIKQKTVSYLVLIIIGLGLGMFLYNFFYPGVLDKPLSFENVKEGSLQLYHKVLGGESKECNKFIETADHEFLCKKDRKVYSCNDKPGVVGEKEVCNGIEQKGIPDVDNHFGSFHLANGNHFFYAEHTVSPKNFYGDDFDVFLTYEVIVKKGDGISGWLVERQVPYEKPIYGTKQVCVWNEANQTDDCWSERDEKNITSYKTLYKFENNETNKTRISIGSDEQPELKTKFFLNKNTFEQNYLIDVIPVVEVVRKSDGNTNVYAQVEWEDISSNRDELIVHLDYNDDLVDQADGEFQDFSNDFIAQSGVTFLDGVGYGTDGKYGFFDSTGFIQHGRAYNWITMDSYTVCTWVNTIQALHRAGFDSGDTLKLYYYSTQGCLVTHNNANTWEINKTFDFRTAGLDNYVCFTYDSGSTTGTFYVNGNFEDRETSLAAHTVSAVNNTFMINADIGTQTGNGESYWDETTIWNVSLTEAEIALLYANDGVPQVPNTAPNNPSITLNFTLDDVNYTNESMWCEVYVVDDDTETDMSVDLIVMNSTTDNILTAVEQYSVADAFTGLTEPVYVQWELLEGNFTKEDYVWCQARVYDQEDYSSWVNSTSLLVHNYPVKISDPLGSWSIDEDFTNFTIDWTGNLTDPDFDEGKDISLNWTYWMNDTEILGINSLDNATDIISIGSLPNATGSVEIHFNVSDSSGLGEFFNETVIWTVNAINEPPAWEMIGNDTVANVLENGGEQPLGTGGSDFNISTYFRDEEDDQTPDNVSVNTNATGVNCNVETNFSVFCTPSLNFSGDFIIIFNGTDSGNNHLETSTEGYVTFVDQTPWWDYIINGSLTIGEDAVDVEVANVSTYFRDVEDDHHPDLGTLFESNNDTTGDLSCHFSEDSFRCTPDNNFTGAVDVEWSAEDSFGHIIYMDFIFIVNETNDVPWWDEIGNDTATNINTSHGKQPVLNNASFYWWDEEDGQAIGNMTVATNETSVHCEVEANYSIFCTPSFFEGDYIIILNGSDSGWLSSLESFEGFVSNEPPTTPTVITPEDNALNDTAQLVLNCSGSTDPEGDTIYYDYFGDTSSTPTTLICSNSAGECAWNNTDANTWVYWYCQSNDTWESSSPIANRSIRTETWDIINLTQTFPSSGEGGENVQFAMNVTWNEIRYKEVTARLNTSWSPYTYTPTKTAHDNYTEFLLNLHLLSVNGTKQFNWDVNLTYHNDSRFTNNSYGGSVDINAVFFSFNCTGNATDVVAANFSFWQENTLKEFSFVENDSLVDFDAVFMLYKDDVNANLTITTGLINISYFTLCIPENTEYKSIAHINYVKDLFDPRQYYFVNQTLNNQTQNINLYLLEIALGNGITFSVEDSVGDFVSGAYIYMYRYDVRTDDYYLVSMGLTDEDGAEYAYLRKFDAFYKFEVWQYGIKVYEDDVKRKIIEDTITLRLGVESAAELLDKFESISYTLVNTSSSIIFTYSDAGTDASKYCLTVYKTNSSDDSYVCNTCLTSRTGTITCDISSDDGIYIANAWAAINPNRPFATLIVEKIKKLVTDFGKTGLFGALLIIITLGSFGLYTEKVSGTVMGVLLGLFISIMLNFINLGPNTYVIFLGLVASGIAISVWCRS